MLSTYIRCLRMWCSPKWLSKWTSVEKSIFVQKYSRSFLKLGLNLWCHMDYFTDVLTILSDLIKNMFIWMKSYRLEQLEDSNYDRNVSFGVNLTLLCYCSQSFLTVLIASSLSRRQAFLHLFFYYLIESQHTDCENQSFHHCGSVWSHQRWVSTAAHQTQTRFSWHRQRSYSSF